MKRLVTLILGIVCLSAMAKKSIVFELERELVDNYLLIQVKVKQLEGEHVLLGSSQVLLSGNSSTLDFSNAILLSENSEFQNGAYEPLILSAMKDKLSLILLSKGDEKLAVELKSKAKLLATVKVPLLQTCKEDQLIWFQHDVTTVMDYNGNNLTASTDFILPNSVLYPTIEEPQIINDGQYLSVVGQGNIIWFVDGEEMVGIYENRILIERVGVYEVQTTNNCEVFKSKPLPVGKVLGISGELLVDNVQVFPNPFIDHVEINYQVTSSQEDVFVLIYDVVGNLVDNYALKNKVRGEHRFVYHVPDKLLHQGVLMLKIQKGNDVYTKRLVNLQD